MAHAHLPTSVLGPHVSSIRILLSLPCPHLPELSMGACVTQPSRAPGEDGALPSQPNSYPVVWVEKFDSPLMALCIFSLC